eukprot:1150049-Pelagomonas_calceolata.AAC.16
MRSMWKHAQKTTGFRAKDLQSRRLTVSLALESMLTAPRLLFVYNKAPLLLVTERSQALKDSIWTGSSYTVEDLMAIDREGRVVITDHGKEPRMSGFLPSLHGCHGAGAPLI